MLHPVKLTLSLTIIAALAGCGGTGTYVRGLSPQQKTQARSLPIFEGTLIDGTYRFIKRVEGLSCRVNAIDNYRVTEAEALDEMRYAAFKAGGTAIMEVSCRRESFRETKYACYESILCEGVAVVPVSKP